MGTHVRKTQVECLKLFHRRLTELRSIDILGTFQEAQFPKPRFHIIMLFIDEEESVQSSVSSVVKGHWITMQKWRPPVWGKEERSGRPIWMKRLPIVGTRLLRSQPMTLLPLCVMFFIIISSMHMARLLKFSNGLFRSLSIKVHWNWMS